MGVYVDKFRELTANLPKTPKDFPGPEFASMCLTQLTNVALQTLGALEEDLEDCRRENERLQEIVMEKMDVWTPHKEG
jgi:hypothetical protein